MKNNKSFFVNIAAFLAILIPSPGRFVYGIVLMFELLLLSVIGTLSISLVKKLKLEEVQSVITIIFLTSFAIFYRQIIVVLYPEIALVLGFNFYLIPISVFFINFIYKDFENPLIERLKTNLTVISFFIILGLIFFLFRDIAAFGTFTFFGSNHQIYEKVLLNPDGVGIFTFFASIPGALILSGLLLIFIILINEKFYIIKNSEAQNDN